MTSYSVTLALYSDPKGYCPENTEFIPRQISEIMGEDQIWYKVQTKKGSGQVNRLTGKTSPGLAAPDRTRLRLTNQQEGHFNEHQ